MMMIMFLQNVNKNHSNCKDSIVGLSIAALNNPHKDRDALKKSLCSCMSLASAKYTMKRPLNEDINSEFYKPSNIYFLHKLYLNVECTSNWDTIHIQAQKVT